MLFYDLGNGSYEIDAPRAVTNLLELVPIIPREHEEAVLAAAAFIEEDDLTSFDALHAGLAATRDERVLSTERDYDAVGVDRVPLADENAE